MRMGQSYWTRIAALVATLLAVMTPSISALPMQMSIMHREKECLYEYAEADESLTFSIIILSGTELKAQAEMDGPVAPPGTDSALALKKASDTYRFETSKKHERVRFSGVVDFEQLNPIRNRDALDDEEEEEVASEGDEESIADRRARRARERKKALERKQREQEDLMHQRNAIREEGDPFQRTYVATHPGWYRFCITASWHNVDVEMDLRRSSELGGVGPDGHVYTLEEKALEDEEKYMEEDTAAQEGIKDEDFESTRTKLKTLRRLLADITNRQQKERHRIQLHSQTNEHSHSRMVLSSLFQTVLFCAVTGFQVFTIRRWFKGAPQLGR